MVSAMNRACGRGTVGELVGELPDREPYRMLSYFAERASAAIRLRTSLGPQTVGFKFCLDDCEVLSGPQRKSINRLVRLSRRSAEHTSELQSLMRYSYAVLCLHKKYELQSLRGI